MTWQQALEQMEQDVKRMRERADEVSEAPERIWASYTEDGRCWEYEYVWENQSEYIRADKAMQWNDNMDEAPRDGRWIAVICDWGDDGEDVFRIVRWASGPWPWKVSGDDDGSIRGDVPTHWMPLPEPPR